MSQLKTVLYGMILVGAFQHGYAQSLSFGIRGTTALIPAVAIENPSPSNIFREAVLKENIGIYALKYFRSGNIGLKALVEFGGYGMFGASIDAPRKAFGTGTGGDVNVGAGFYSNALAYKSFSLQAAYKLPLKNRFIEITAGPRIRHYGYDRAGFDEIMMAFSRSTPYDPDIPGAGPPDLRVRVVDLHKFHWSFPISADYVVRATKRIQAKFGMMYNISRPLEGELEVQMYGQMYQGTYRPRTGYWGVNVQVERLTKKSAAGFVKRVWPPASRTDSILKFRKTIYAEGFIRNGYLSANFDLRLKKGQNHGFGVRGGVGMGDGYWTNIENVNKNTRERALAFPLGVNYILGKKQHGMEMGLGVRTQVALHNIREGTDDIDHFTFPLTVGYRYQPLREGFAGRVAWEPFAGRWKYDTDFNHALVHIGFGVGYSFK